MWTVPENFRITPAVYNKMNMRYDLDFKKTRHWITDNIVGPQGFFILPNPNTMKGFFLLCLASNGYGWEHVSVSIPTESRCPTWEEMCFVKNHFWGPEDTVVQFHPPEAEYVNEAKFCLHLWKQVGKNFQLPPTKFVGNKKEINGNKNSDVNQDKNGSKRNSGFKLFGRNVSLRIFRGRKGR